LKNDVMREVTQSSIIRDVLKEAVVQEVAQSNKKMSEAMDQERKDREDRYLLLHSQLANFQYDFAVERNERTQLHGELISIKSEVTRKVEIVSQDMRAIQAGEKQALALAKPSAQVSMVDSLAMPEAVKLEVARVFSEQLANQREWINQDKSLRASDVLNIETKIAELTKDFSKRIEGIMDKPKGRYTDEDLFTRSEFEDQYRQILDAAVGQDSGGGVIPRDEFEDHLQRLWEAIMQLQAKQLEELREKSRAAAFNNGLASQMGNIGSPRKLLNSTKAITGAPFSSTPSSVMPKSDKSSPQSRHSGSSPYRNTLGRSTLSSGQPTPPHGGGTNIFTAPTTLLNDNLIPTPPTISDAVTPRTPGIGLRTPGVPLYRNQ